MADINGIQLEVLIIMCYMMEYRHIDLVTLNAEIQNASLPSN